MNLNKLEVWMRAGEFALAIFKEVVPHLPADEKWNLPQQLKRASQSIAANIAEAQSHYKK
jgi:four helix bundle protein